MKKKPDLKVVPKGVDPPRPDEQPTDVPTAETDPAPNSADVTPPTQENFKKPARDDVRCQWMVQKKSGESVRCPKYTWKLVEGGRSAYCLSHTNTRAAREKKSEIGKMGADRGQEQAARVEGLKVKVGLQEIITQDDVALARQRILYQLSIGELAASTASAMLSAVQQQSNHIEMFGGKQGVEGGSGYLRILPGVKLVEQQTAANNSMDSEEMKVMYELMAADRRNGNTPPVTWEERYLLYMGVRRAPEVAYDDKTQEPVGEYRCELFVDKAGKKRVRRFFVPYKSGEMAKARLEHEARLSRSK